MKQKMNKIYKSRIIIFSIISVLILCTLFNYVKCENFINEIINPLISKNMADCDFRVHFIDVGQGDSIFIEFPDNKLMLIDAGPNSGEEKLVSYLDKIFEKRDNKNIDYFVLTHIDSDHIGGADKIFERYNIFNCYRPNIITESEVIKYGEGSLVSNDSEYIDLVNRISAENCCETLFTFATDNLLNLDTMCGYSVKFLAPLESLYTDSNDYSSVIMISYLNRNFLFMADADSEVERKLIDNYGNLLKADVIKIGHHGSKTSSSYNFINEVNPNYAVICVGKNTYGHPTEEALNNINEFVDKNDTYRTDKNGDIVFGVNKNNSKIMVKTHKRIFTNLYISWWAVIVVFIAINFLCCFCIKRKKVSAN